MRLRLALLWLLAAPAAAQVTPPAAPPATTAGPPPAREITVANDTGRTVTQLFVFPASTSAEGEDRLGSGTLPPRATLRVALGRTRACQFALRAVLDDGGEERRRVDVCRATRVGLTETGPRRELAVVNATDLALRELYLSPPGEAQGPDRLGAETVAPGATQTLRLRGFPGCVGDVRAVFADGSAETRSGVDICRPPRLVLGDPDAPVREVTVTNRGRAVIRELYARPQGAPAWGPDRLGDGTLEPRATTRLRLRGGCLFDLRAVRESGPPELRRGVDVCAEAAIALGGAPVADDGGRRVTLSNGFSRTIREVYVSAAEADEWGEDRLGERTLAPGARQELRLETGCAVDLRIVFDNDAAEERRNVDVCAAATIALRPGWTVDNRLPAPRDVATPEVVPAAGSRLRNAGALPVVELYADPPGAPRGPDRLGRTVLGAGETMPFAAPDGCTVDLVAVFRDGREVLRRGLDLCAGEEVVLP